MRHGRSGRSTTEAAHDDGRQKARRRLSLGILFMAPALIIFLVFLIIPIAASIYLSFTDWNGITPVPEDDAFQSIGFDNYSDLLRGQHVEDDGRVVKAVYAPKRLFYRAEKHDLLCVGGGPVPDGDRAHPGRDPESALAQGEGLLPHRVLFPIDHVVGGDLDHLYVDVPARRSGQYVDPGVRLWLRQRRLCQLARRPARDYPYHSGKVRRHRG